MKRNSKGQFIKGETPSNKEDLIGKRFGRLIVIADAPPKILPCGQKKRQVLCRCDCGNEIIVQANCLKNGSTKSCGCLRSELSAKRRKKKFNDHIIEGNIVKIFDDTHTYVCLIDLEDLPKVQDYHWCYKPSYKYWTTTVGKKQMRIHMLILDKWCDHKSGDTCDNRKSNLRKCTNQQNSWNTRVAKDNKTGYKGVYKKRNRYVARIQNEIIGHTDTPEEAARLYDKRAIELFGEWARLNFPEEYKQEDTANEQTSNP